MTIRMDEGAAELLDTLHRAGYAAYVVGGCVRDSLLGLTPHDWDLCTSALPQQGMELFGEEKCIPTGLQHGTVTVKQGGRLYETTTFRTEGAYSDGRHPDSVAFVPDVREDLARRDFTINAMAYSAEEGLIDPFGGQADLQSGILRAVGVPHQRFTEDALRILRALRFTAKLGFTLEPATAAAALAARDTLRTVSAERLYAELDGLLLAPGAGKTLAQYGEILGGVVPEILPCIGCTQPGRWHCYDVWQHTAVAVELLDVAGMDDKNARILRWSVFLHDLAKPECRTVGPDGAAHFPGHNQAGSKMARSILLRLKAPTYLVESASALVAIHDGALPSDDAGILNMLNRYGAAFLQRLCRLKLADLAAHALNAGVMQREQQVRAFEGRMLELSATACYTVGQLAVNGASLMDAGIAPGPAVGKALNTLLRAVMEGRLPNEKAALLAALEKAQQTEDVKYILENRAYLSKKSIWAVGGDGWAYDIGFGGIDHVMAQNRDVNLLVLDTEVYSNTGGQASKATPTSATAKFAAGGKQVAKKDLGGILMQYGYVYVAQVAMGADQAQTLKALREAESYDGPSIVICYCPCLEQHIKAGMSNSQLEMKKAVECGYWHLYRYDPRRIAEGKNPFQLDSPEPDTDKLMDFLMGENRFASLKNNFPEKADALYAKEIADVKARYAKYKKMAQD